MTRRPDAVDSTLALLEEELAIEEHLKAQDLKRERFGAPGISGVPVCLNCGALITKTAAGWWVHMGVTSCSRVVVTVEEVPGR